jgi:hypothetical protein
VYAIYRKSFLETTLAKQSIENDGVFTNLVASEGLGSFTDEVLFRKQYLGKQIGGGGEKVGGWQIPSGMVRSLFDLVQKPRSISSTFQVQKLEALKLLTKFYPEYELELTQIFSKYLLDSKEPFIIEPNLWIN